MGVLIKFSARVRWCKRFSSGSCVLCAHMCAYLHISCELRERAIKSPAEGLTHLAASHAEPGPKCMKLKENDYIWKYLLIPFSWKLK